MQSNEAAPNETDRTRVARVPSKDFLESVLDPSPYRERYADDTVQPLMHAIDILHVLMREVCTESSSVPYRMLSHAKAHVDERLSGYFERPTVESRA